MALCRNVKEGGRGPQKGGERSELYYHTPDHAARAGAGWVERTWTALQKHQSWNTICSTPRVIF